MQVVLEANFDCFADRVDQHLGRVQLRLAFPAYAEKANEIAPKQVMIYTIDRETPAQGLQKATHEELDGIAERARKAGFDVTVSY